MSEETWNAASSAASEAKRMFAETRNPFWVVQAIAAAEWVKQTPEKWAVEALHKAVAEAWTQSEVFGKALSIDAALGLTTRRGREPARKAAVRSSLESDLMVMTTIILTCYEVSIPTACEIAYFSIDQEFASGMDESGFEPLPSDFKARMIGAGWNATAIDAAMQDREADFMSRMQYPPAVAAKVRDHSWWTVTRGDRLGYSLESFIQSYHRKGSKRVSARGNAGKKIALLLRGEIMTIDPESCTHAILFDLQRRALPAKSKSALAGLPMRPDFAALRMRLSQVGTVVK